MGTNFFTKHPNEIEDLMDPKFHIGKRSAAGPYCWKCGITLCKKGNSRVHYSDLSMDSWYKSCPVCGNGYMPKDFSQSSAGKELGFNKNPPLIKVGVTSCCSFNWAMHPNNLNGLSSVYDEYGQSYTFFNLMLMILLDCPIQYYDSIGEMFG